MYFRHKNQLLMRNSSACFKTRLRLSMVLMSLIIARPVELPRRIRATTHQSTDKDTILQALLLPHRAVTIMSYLRHP